MKGKGRHVLYLIGAIAMLVYALPKLDLGAPWGLTSTFGMIWVGFALIVIAAHFNALLLINEAKRKELERIRRAKKRMWERQLQGVVAGRSRDRVKG
ncbi:hypothetical protein [Paenibacillus radicis (ex Gao et al. 2016)]|uniref:2TM domain-containing protein n=1 Tax=Paenibacillus radicis (ex Gao et al. 2016) TaxID=1737354 RepID=A0A917HDA5_9BACL|nr:hypothetical protein [Paenibacillus radicis (ex Gao et al. 2016)]GGG74835.1 hypothetical protein GCM10010918_33760 [Paenibacillus radicis (ex Gao et al. 2016)]